MLEIREPINVLCLFKNVSIIPLYFSWKGRRIKIDKVNLIHTSKVGSTLFYHFSVSGGGNFYRLKLDTNKMSWFLEVVDEDDTAY